MKYMIVLTPYMAAGDLDFKKWQLKICSLTEGFPNSQEIQFTATPLSRVIYALPELPHHQSSSRRGEQVQRESIQPRENTQTPREQSNTMLKLPRALRSSEKLSRTMKPRDCHYCTEKKNSGAKETPSVWTNMKPKQLQDTLQQKMSAEY